MGFKLPLLFVLINFGSLVIAQSNYTFPEGFMFGVATSAYQIEGATSEDGKSENVWDYLLRTDTTYLNNVTADIACDSYHKYKEDVALMAAMGVTHYRFSISWSRILSTLYQNKPNLLGIKYYQNLVDELLAYNIIPVATLHHWDTPQSLQDIGGWMNEEMVYHFENYARVVFQYLPKVQYWITFNEPHSMCLLGYSKNTMPPLIEQTGISEYTCNYIVLKAHAAAYHVYKNEFPELTGKITIALDAHWSEPASNSTEDVEAAERRLQFEHGLYGNVLVNGNWPQIVIDRVNYRSEMGNFSKSRLPVFTEEESNLIKGSFDFYSVNFYTSTNVSDADEASFNETSYTNDMKVLADEQGGRPGAGGGGGMGGGGGGIGGGGEGIGGGGEGIGGGEGGIGGGGGGIGGGGGGIGGGGGGIGGGEGGIGGGGGGIGGPGGGAGGGPSNDPSSVSWAMKKSINWIKEQYGDLDIFIMENGVPTMGSDDQSINDTSRMEYIQEFLTVVLEMIHEDNINILGYTLWSLMDNFQWWFGYDSRYGLHYVNFTDPERPRTARISTQYYKQIIESRSIPDEFPTTAVTTTTTTAPENSETTSTTSTTTSTTPADNSSPKYSALPSVFLVVIFAVFRYLN